MRVYYVNISKKMEQQDYIIMILSKHVKGSHMKINAFFNY